MFEWIKNKRVRHEAEETYKCFLNDDIVREEVAKISAKIKYAELVECAIESCFYNAGEEDCYSPYLDKKYLDISWLQVGKKIINLDDIYQVIINDAREQAEELEK